MPHYFIYFNKRSIPTSQIITKRVKAHENKINYIYIYLHLFLNYIELRECKFRECVSLRYDNGFELFFAN